MLAKAIQRHDSSGASGGLKGTTLSQSLKGNGTPLKPSLSSTVNASRQSWPSPKNPLKRTSSQASIAESVWNGQEETGRKKSSMERPRSSADMDRLGTLHDHVAFDENDFEDDENIDLSEDPLPATNTTLPTNTSRSSLPTVSNKVAATPQTPASSAPLPWSSSPLEHHNPPAKLNLQAFKYSQNQNLLEKTSTATAGAGPSKRRTLPWLAEEAARDQEDAESMLEGASNNVPAHVQKIIERNTKKKAERIAAGGLARPRKGMPDFVKDIVKNSKERNAQSESSERFTPLPKDRPDSPYPWNKTASAVKEEQRALRRGLGHKKRVHDPQPNPEEAARAVKLKRQSVHRVFLSEEQKSVLSLVSEKQKSVFFTGSAGTGKSVLMREVIKFMRDKYKREPDRVAVTASTGLAACNIGGVTLHSFAGIGLGKEDTPELVKKIKRNPKSKNRWIRTKVLIIDEISMVDGELFDKLEAIARIIRNNGRPFGGIQLVITGDFFQLPPVPDYNKVAKFSFDAATWNTAVEHTIGLSQVFRQKDPVFANMLNEMRLGRLTPKSINAFKALSRPLDMKDDFEATELFPTRNEVDHANIARMKNLHGMEFEFKAEDAGSITDVEMRTKLLSNCMAPPSIKLKKGAMVMMIKNLDETIVNGTVGKVMAFMDERTFDYYIENEDEFQAVESIEPDVEETTASRKKLKAFLHKDGVGSTSRKWPLVQFQITDGTFRQLLCQPESWKIEQPNGEVQASRLQIPLILAWALSIHKAQGQTLERVKVDLGKIFEKGQAYVALSRATCQEGLHISRFDPKKVMAHDRVRTFYDGLYSAQEATMSTGAQVKPKVKEEDLVKGEFDDDEDAWAAIAAM